MSNITIATALTLPDGSNLDSIQGTITEVYRQRPAGGAKAQDAKLRDGTGAEIKLTIWDHPDCSIYKGRDVVIASGPKGGLKIKFDNYRPPGVNAISVSKMCTFTVVSGGAPAPSGGGGAAPAPAPTSQSNSSPTIIVNGAKVGMALNNACLFLTSAGEQFSSDRVFEVASELIRLSNRMEQGELAQPKEDVPY